jgi:uncharacterized protein YdeI (YjbR/CyaY-like superfamily)
VFFKRHTDRPNVSYEDAVREALCFGWIDGTIQRIDADRYARRFTPRRSRANWSAINRRRFAKMVEAGRMTPAGLAKFAPDPGRTKTRSTVPVVPDFLRRALRERQRARENFARLAPSYRRAYIAWIGSAKREETRRRRLAEALRLLERGEKLGMK